MRTWAALLVICCILSFVNGDNRVEVVVLTESLCPDCVEFANTDFKELLNAEGVFERVAMRFLAWGNAYTETYSDELCPSPTPGKYVGSVLKCWSTHCVRDAKPELFAECFNTSFEDRITCQHGEEEGIGNLIETCAVQLTRNSTDGSLSRTGANFIQCYLGQNHGLKNATLVCANNAGIDYNSIMTCVTSGVGYSYLREVAIQTNDYGTHPGVPYVIIDGVPLPDGASMLKAICDKIEGGKPAGCKLSSGSVNRARSWYKC